MENNFSQNTNSKIKYAFWGTGPLAESALYALYKNNYLPEYIFTKPDAEVGREKVLTAPMIKKWGEIKNIKVLQPTKLKLATNNSNENLTSENQKESEIIKEKIENEKVGYELLKNILKEMDVCIVASYGKIIPKEILDLPKYGFINIHPSDLPKLRGPSPIENALLNNEKEMVISIMKLDEKMDAGEIIIKNKFNINHDDTCGTLELKAGAFGGEMLANILDAYINGNIKTQKQNEEEVTFCKFVKKEDGEIFLNKEEINGDIKFEKIIEIKNKWRAYNPWPLLYFYYKHNSHNKSNTNKSEENENKSDIKSEEKNIRVKITNIDLSDPFEENINNVILKVTPEGKKEMSFEDFKRGYVN